MTAPRSPADYDPQAFPPFAVTADVVVFTIATDQLEVLLVRRGAEPFEGAWALPGGFVLPDEDLRAAAERELQEETGIEAGPAHLAQLGAYGDPGRDPRMRVVTVAWWAIVPDLARPVAGTDAAAAELVAVDDLIDQPDRLAFDHHSILSDALGAARSAIEDTAVATSFLDDTFRISELRRVYETIWGVDLEPGNFQRKVRGLDGFLTPAGTSSATTTGRPAALFSCADSSAALATPFRRPDG